MCKQKSIIFAFFTFLLVLSGCGVKGPLYQTSPEPESTQQEKSVKANNHNSDSNKAQVN